MMQRAGLVLAAAVIGACGGGDGGNGSNPVVTVAKDAAQSGDAQTAVVATELPESLRVIVKEDGAVKAGVTVNWSTTVAGATILPATSVTDAAGLARVSFTLGIGAGSQSAKAAVSGATGSPVTFNATGTHDVASAFVTVSGSGQSVSISSAFPQPLLVRVSDQFNNPIAGVTVNWAVNSGDLQLNAASSVTSAAGQAAMSVSGGTTAGAGVVRATTASVAGTNLDFNLTLTPFATTAAVHTAGISYVSDHNLTSDPAIDTIGVGGTVTWSGLGALGTHLVRSIGGTSFTSQPAASNTYSFTFNTVGTYQYDCANHNSPLMYGSVVVR